MKAFFREPVFVDPTGRRSRTLRRAGVLVVAPTSAYLVLMVSSVLGGPTIDTPLLPPAAAEKLSAGAQAGPKPAVPVGRVDMPTKPGSAIDVLDKAAIKAAPTNTGQQGKSSAAAPVGKAKAATAAAKPAKAAASKSSTPTTQTSANSSATQAVPKAAAKSVAPKPVVPKSVVPKAAAPKPVVRKAVVRKPAASKPAVLAPVIKPLAPVVDPVVAVVRPVLSPVVDPVVGVVGGLGGLLGLGK